MHHGRQADHRAQLPRRFQRGHAPPRHERSQMDEAAAKLGRASFRNHEMDDGLSAIPGPGTGQGEVGTGAWRALLQSQAGDQHARPAAVAPGAARRTHLKWQAGAPYRLAALGAMQTIAFSHGLESRDPYSVSHRMAAGYGS